MFNLGIGWCAVVGEPVRRRDGDRAHRVIGVLVCGNGSNLQALLDAGLPIGAVASNRNDAYALVRAREAGRAERRRSASTATPIARSATS